MTLCCSAAPKKIVRKCRKTGSVASFGRKAGHNPDWTSECDIESYALIVSIGPAYMPYDLGGWCFDRTNNWRWTHG